jgi:tRNA G18 (ribose-2'-O)-methylase SpoU
MAKTVRLATPNDPRLSRYLNLKDRDVRRETGLFLAEGEQVVRRAFAAVAEGRLPRVASVLVVESKVERVRAMIRAAGSAAAETQILACPKDVIQASVGFHLHQGMIAAAEPAAYCSVDQIVEEGVGGAGFASSAGPASRVVAVCPEITNVDNLGLLVRVCAGLGVGAMVLGPRCGDPWYRRAVRVSMGAVFGMPMVRSGDLPADLRRLRDAGYESVATVIDADAPALRELAVPTGYRGAVLLGSEGYGLPADLVALCDRRVRIPMHHDIDSLNVAVAAGIVLHHLVRG